MLSKTIVTTTVGLLALAGTAPAFALNPQPLPPGYASPHAYSAAIKKPIIPPACRGPVKYPNPCW